MPPADDAVAQDDLDVRKSDPQTPEQTEGKTWMPLGLALISGIWFAAVFVMAYFTLLSLISQGTGMTEATLTLVMIAVLAVVAYGIWKKWKLSWFIMQAASLAFVAFSIYTFAIAASMAALVPMILQVTVAGIVILYLLSEGPVEWFGLDPRWSRI